MDNYKFTRASDIAYRLTKKDVENGLDMVRKGLTAQEAACGLAAEKEEAEHQAIDGELKPLVVQIIADRLRATSQLQNPDLLIEGAAAKLTIDALKGTRLNWSIRQIESGRSPVSCAYELLGDMRSIADRVRATAVEQTRSRIELEVDVRGQRAQGSAN